MIKKIFRVFFAFTLLAAALLAYFVLTFDANRYRPYLIERIEKLSGLHADFDQLSLTWREGLALEAANLKFSQAGEKAAEAPVTAARIEFLVEARPLLHGQLRLGALRLRDWTILMIRQPNGHFTGAADLFERKAPASEKPGNGPEAAALLISRLQFDRGKIVFRDLLSQPAHEYAVSDITIRVDDLSPVSPADMDVKASFLSRTQNLHLQGRIKPELMQRAVTFEDFHFDTDLSQVDVEKAIELFPEAQNFLRQSELQGLVRVSLDPVRLSPGQFGQPVIQLQISGGSFRLPGAAAPISGVTLHGKMAFPQGAIDELSAQLGQGRLASSGTFQVSSAGGVSGEFHAVVTNLLLEQWVPPSREGAPEAHGSAAAAVEVSFAGRNGREVTESVHGTGQISTKNFVVKNLNIMREILNGLSLIPGLGKTLTSRLSEDYQSRLQARDTYFEPVEIPFVISQGLLTADRFSLVTDSVEVFGGVQISLAGPLSGRGSVAMDRDFSNALSRSVQELDYLRDRSGRMSLPLLMGGTVVRPQISADLTDIGSRLAVGKSQELLSGFLAGKKKDTADSSQSDASVNAQGVAHSQTAADPIADLLGAFLAKNTKKK